MTPELFVTVSENRTTSKPSRGVGGWGIPSRLFAIASNNSVTGQLPAYTAMAQASVDNRIERCRSHTELLYISMIPSISLRLREITCNIAREKARAGSALQDSSETSAFRVGIPTARQLLLHANTVAYTQAFSTTGPFATPSGKSPSWHRFRAGRASRKLEV